MCSALLAILLDVYAQLRLPNQVLQTVAEYDLLWGALLPHIGFDGGNQIKPHSRFSKSFQLTNLQILAHSARFWHRVVG